jgi:hypothetical protein
MALCHRQAFEIAVTYFAEDKSKASPDEFFNHFAQFRLSFQVRNVAVHSLFKLP